MIINPKERTDLGSIWNLSMDVSDTSVTSVMNINNDNKDISKTI